jgi:hypothetical protein
MSRLTWVPWVALAAAALLGGCVAAPYPYYGPVAGPVYVTPDPPPRGYVAGPGYYYGSPYYAAPYYGGGYRRGYYGGHGSGDIDPGADGRP